MYKTGDGFTPSEKYLKYLCGKTFLSLWSYTNVFRQSGTELCDLLVIVGNDIIIFSDKNCLFPQSDDLNISWQRWFRKAVIKSAKQLWGAENWIRKYPDRIFLDNKCEHKIPIPIVVEEHTRFHLVLVAHGASSTCAQILGGSGSLMFNNNIEGFENHQKPFVIGDLDKDETFVHVLDDTTLDILLKTRDTIADFTSYLIKREKFLRSDVEIFSTGEEEMLPAYLKNLNENDEHDFVLPKHEKGINRVSFLEGSWTSFQANPQRLAQLEADKISYMWDRLIEEYSKHALAGTQYHVSEGGFQDSEKAIRFLAGETRFARRVLASHLHEIILKTPSHLNMLRVIPMTHDNLYYAFVLFPYPKDFPVTYDEYRTARGNYLEAVCLVIRLMNPDAKHVVGVAMESGLDTVNRSEDLLVFDCSCWCEEIEKQAQEDQRQFGILTRHNYFERNNREYPDVK